MKRLLIMTTVVSACMGMQAQQPLPQLGQSPVKEVVKAMTLKEKLNLVVGMGFGFDIGDGDGLPKEGVVGNNQALVPGSAGTTYAIPRLGVPTTVVADGPAGLRISPTRDNDSSTYYCTGFPVATCVASTWNVDLAQEIGKSMGEEVRDYGVDVLLAPAMNIMRNPLCGRNFEYYSEDPFVSGMISAAVVKGIQSQGVGTSVKHFAANNQETKRYFTESHVSQRALRELYLKGFRYVVEQAQPWTIMTSYNRLNGSFTSENKDLLTTILRDEWGFKGLVMTDWNSGTDNAGQINAGNDLLMPGFPQNHKDLQRAVLEGRLDMTALNKSCERMLEYILKTPRFRNYTYSNKPDLKAHAQITRQSAAEGTVLLKNQASTLPFTARVRKIALFGNTSFDFIAGGTGSGDVNKAYTVSLVEGLQNVGYELIPSLQEIYTGYLAEQKEIAKTKQTESERFFGRLPQMPEWIPSDAQLKQVVKESDVAVLTFGRSSGEAFDRQLNDFYLSASERALLENVCRAFHKAKKKVVVVLNIGGVIETASWKDLPDAILLPWQGGQEGGNTVADILKGNVNPSGRLPMTFPLDYKDVPSAENFPYNYVLDQKYLFPTYDDLGKSFKKNEDFTDYEGGIFVGYRYYDTFKKSVSYPFGFGLSYTDFAYTNASVKEENGIYTVIVDVTNQGKKAGKEVVQLYIKAPEGSIDKPARELKAFCKTPELKAGETKSIVLKVPLAELASFHTDKSAWIADAGEYTIELGSNSRDVKAELTFMLENTVLTEKVHDVLAPQNPINELKR